MPTAFGAGGRNSNLIGLVFIKTKLITMIDIKFTLLKFKSMRAKPASNPPN